MRVGSTISWYTTGRVGSPTQRVGSGPEMSDPWSTLIHTQPRTKANDKMTAKDYIFTKHHA